MNKNGEKVAVINDRFYEIKNATLVARAFRFLGYKVVFTSTIPFIKPIILELLEDADLYFDDGELKNHIGSRVTAAMNLLEVQRVTYSDLMEATFSKLPLTGGTDDKEETDENGGTSDNNGTPDAT